MISVYFFIKLLHRRKNQVFFLSRQFDEPSLNYQAIMKRLEDEKIPYKFICKKVNANINDSIRTQGNYSNTFSFLKKTFSHFHSALGYYFDLYKQMRYIAQSKVIIVDGYNLPVSLLKHKKGTKVIQMWHALGAIKQFGYQTIGRKDGISPKVAKILKMHANYDYVLSGSVGMNPFFAEAFHVSEEKVLPIGTPTVDYMRMKDKKIAAKITKKYPSMKEKINVLYSPTFRNDKRQNLEELVKYFDFEKANLLITFHPKVENSIADDRILVIDREEFSTFDIVKMVDYVITDYSALMIDAAVANKKILLYVYDYEKYEEDNGLNIHLLEDYPHLASKSGKKIVETILNNLYDEKEYKAFKAKYVPNIKSSTEEIMKLIKECLYE